MELRAVDAGLDDVLTALVRRSKPAAAGQVRVNLNSREYPVTTKTGKTRRHATSFYDTMFVGKEQPLCRYTNVKGCEKAVAVTSWTFDVDHGLYAADGARRKLDTNCDVNVLMPVWVNPTPEEELRVRRFLAATKTHEMGHAAACLSVMSVVHELMEHMPVRIAPTDVDVFNGAFAMFVRDFYVQVAHKVDHDFDENTAHGGIYEAQLDDTDSSDSDMDIKTLHKLAERATTKRRGGKASKRKTTRRPRSRDSTRSTAGKKSSFLSGISK